MGIRFACHECGKRLNIKNELAGRRGVCPACSAKIRIPMSDAEVSTPILDTPSSPSDEDRVEVSPPAAIPAGPSFPPVTDTVPSLREHDPESTWYVRPPSGGQYGPATTELMREWIGEGRIAASALLWRDGWPQWRAAADAFPELAAKLPGWQPSQPPEVRNASPLNSEPIGTASLTSKTEFAGQSTIGAQRRVRSSRRVLWIGLLSAVAIMLVGVLVVVANLR